MEETNPQESLVHEIYRALQRLGAPAQLLGIVSSWGDTLNEQEVVAMLKVWNESTETGAKQMLRAHIAANSGYQ